MVGSGRQFMGLVGRNRRGDHFRQGDRFGVVPRRHPTVPRAASQIAHPGKIEPAIAVLLRATNLSEGEAIGFESLLLAAQFSQRIGRQKTGGERLVRPLESFGGLFEVADGVFQLIEGQRADPHQIGSLPGKRAVRAVVGGQRLEHADRFQGLLFVKQGLGTENGHTFPAKRSFPTSASNSSACVFSPLPIRICARCNLA